MDEKTNKKLVVEFGGYAPDGEYVCAFEAATPTMTGTEVFSRAMNLIGRPVHEMYWRLSLGCFAEIEDNRNTRSNAIIQGFTVSSYDDEDGSTVLFESGTVGERVRAAAEAARDGRINRDAFRRPRSEAEPPPVLTIRMSDGKVLADDQKA